MSRNPTRLRAAEAPPQPASRKAASHYITLAVLDYRTSRALFTVLLFAAVLALLYIGRRTFLAFLFAVFFAYLLEPVVEYIQRRTKGSRGLAIAVTYALLVIAVAILFATAGPRVISEGKKLADALPGLTEKVGSGRIIQEFGSRRGWSANTQAQLQHFIARHRQDIVYQAQAVARQTASVAAALGWVLLVPILAIFFLKDEGTFSSALVSMLDTRRERHFLRGVLDDLDAMLAQYIRAQLTLAGISIVVFTVFFSIMRLPYGLILGVIGGMLEFIPFVGPLITAILVTGVAFLTGYSHPLLIVLFLGLWRICQDYVNAPYLMQKGLELHPLAVIFGILLGGEVAGVVGIFLSIPVMSTLRILWRNWRLRAATEAGITQVVAPAAPERKAA